MWRHVAIFGAYLAQNLKIRLGYRQDFIAQTLGTLVYGVVNITLLWVLLTKAPSLRGWSFWEVVFFYGFGELTFSLFSVFLFSGLQNMPRTYILGGGLDRMLVRPLNPLFQVAMENLNLNDLVITLKGLIIIAVSQHFLPQAARLDTWSSAAALFLMAPGGGLVYAGAFLAVESLTFWFKSPDGVLQPLYRIIDYSRYPLTIYPPAVRVFFSWVLPFAFTAFYPSVYFLRPAAGAAFLLLTPVAGVLTFAAGYAVWRAGLARYESSGS